jgi:hypothetical protein
MSQEKYIGMKMSFKILVLQKWNPCESLEYEVFARLHRWSRECGFYALNFRAGIARMEGSLERLSRSGPNVWMECRRTCVGIRIPLLPAAEDSQMCKKAMISAQGPFAGLLV